MNRRANLSTLGIISYSVLVMGFPGCRSGSSGPDDLSAEQKHIMRAVGLLNEYATATKKRPKSIDEVKDWAVKEGKGQEDDFSSTRDKQPYGIAAGAEGMGGFVVYEQTGKGGKCYFYRMGQINEIKQDEVDNAIKMAQSMGRPMGQRGTPSGKK